MSAKHIFVTGGVVSSLGKGITSASLGRLLKSRGLGVVMQKLDPYINVDPGTMNPFQHGEVFVTDDGSETDLDLGHYERFVDVNLTQESNVTTGVVYWTVISRERKGDFLGATVQVIPHITNEIKRRILKVGMHDDVDVVITEVGGTVGDIEGLPFLEAIRQLKKDVGRENTFYIHVTLIPYLETSAELKTKPTQHSVKELKSLGIEPDAIVCRSNRPISQDTKDKIALFCDVDTEAVISAVNTANIYEVPIVLKSEGLDDYVVRHLQLEEHEQDFSEWEKLVDRINNLTGTVKIGIVGKYVDLPDAYISIVESLKHGGIEHGWNVEPVWIASDILYEKDPSEALSDVDGILVPGGFGIRGIDGKIKAIEYARVNGVPFLGLCLGLQCAVIEYSRNVLGLEDANSSEFEPDTKNPVIDLMQDQRTVEEMGGTMRLGIYPCSVQPGSIAEKSYGESVIYERHRHRYELNNKYRKILQEAGMVFSGISPDDRLVEMIEIADHPWFVACQFHPEFKSRPLRPHPLFRDFVEAAVKRQKIAHSHLKLVEKEEA